MRQRRAAVTLEQMRRRQGRTPTSQARPHAHDAGKAARSFATGVAAWQTALVGAEARRTDGAHGRSGATDSERGWVARYAKNARQGREAGRQAGNGAVSMHSRVTSVRNRIQI